MSKASQVVNELEVVRHAVKRGFQPDSKNKARQKHFYFYGPVQMHIALHNTVVVYTVGHHTTDSPVAALAMVDLAFV